MRYNHGNRESSGGIRTAAGGQSIADRLRALSSELSDAPAITEIDNSAVRTVSWRDFVDSVTKGTEVYAGDGAPVVVAAQNNAASLVEILSVLAANRTVVPIDVGTSPARSERTLLNWSQSELPGSGYALMTGGTTGTARLIRRSHRIEYSSDRYPSTLMRATGFREGQSQLLLGGVNHVAAFEHVLQAVLSGCEVVIPTTVTPELVRSALIWRPIGWASMTPSHMALIRPLILEAPLWHNLSGLMHTAAPCPPDLKMAFVNGLGARRVFEVYGSTEGIGLTLCRGDQWLAHKGSVGRGYMTQIEVRDHMGRTMPPGVVGEIFMRALVDPSGGAAGGQWRTVHDYGRLDEDGFLYIVGRVDDMVQVGGENVWCGDVDRAFAAHDEVLESATIARSHGDLGHILVSAVQPVANSTVTVHQLREYLSAMLPRQSQPSIIRLVAAVPRGRNGKLRRYDLEEMLDRTSDV